MNFFNKKKQYNFYLFEFDSVSKDDNMVVEVEKIKKKCKGKYFDSFVSETDSYFIFSDFKPDEKIKEKILEMFIYFSYAYVKKKNDKVFDDVLFKVKPFNKNNKLIHLKYNV